MLVPERLHKGDKVGLIAPSSWLSEQMVKKAIENLRLLALEPVYYPIERYGYLAGSDEFRRSVLLKMFSNKELRAIFSLRGGYGATRLLPFIDYSVISENPKIFVGYSDITALHLAFWHKVGLIGIHGIVAKSEFNAYTVEQLDNLLFGRYENKPLACKKGNNFMIIRDGTARGRLLGGNLSLLQSLIATGFLPSFAGKIVFIEEVNEPPYKIDRMLEHLLQATDLSFAAGLVFGSFNKCQPQDHNILPENSFNISDIIVDKFGNLGVPVVFDVNFGHIDNQCIFPIGVEVLLQTKPFRVILLESPVK